MSDMLYLQDIPHGEILLDDSVDPPVAVVTENVLRQLSEYSCSLPTGPKVGRIYKTNARFGTPEVKDPEWWIRICVPDPSDDKYMLHVTRKAVLMEE
jgi:hypothetical protein